MIRWERRARLGLLAAAALAGLGASCLLELERGVSCGDGWWDESHEACDASALDVLPPGISCPTGSSGSVACRSDCTLDFDACELVPACGNGVLDPGEECDPAIDCSSDVDCPAASPVCETELGECMPRTPGGDPARTCEVYEVTAYNHGKDQAAYTEGQVGRCTRECVFDREACSFCGDGELDGVYNDLGWPDVEYDQPAEVCDGEADPTELSHYCAERCGKPDSDEVLYSCSYPGCSDDCEGIEPLVDTPGQDPTCCVIGGTPCVEGEGALGLPCCYWLDNEEFDGVCVETDADISVCPG